MSHFTDKLVQITNDEFAKYQGLSEGTSPLRERIGEYWKFLHRPDLDGSDHDVPWSAAFISFMVHLSGADTFPVSTQHSTYFYRTINDKLTLKKTAFWGYKPGDLTIAPGDILGMNRGTAAPIDYDWAAHHADYKSHSDIVVAVDAAGVHTIGGNVGAAPGQVAKKTFTWKDGTLSNAAAHKQQVFVVIHSFLP